jgi:hypothetical protein
MSFSDLSVNLGGEDPAFPVKTALGYPPNGGICPILGNISHSCGEFVVRVGYRDGAKKKANPL